jgi:hypothetical protein
MSDSIASRLIEEHKTAQAVLDKIEQSILDYTWGTELIEGKSVIRCILFQFQDGSRINFFDNGTFSIVE